jgi:hypothetical protein
MKLLHSTRLWALSIFTFAVMAAVMLFGAFTSAVGRVAQAIFEPLWQSVVNPPRQMVLGSNVLTNLAADIYKAADMVGREVVGIVTSCTMNPAEIQRVAKGDVIRSAFTRPVTVNSSFAPSMTIPEGTDQTVDNKTMALNNYYSVQIPWTGEDIKHVNNGSGFETIYGDQVKQAIRAIVNAIELMAWQEAYKNASRAWGTAGTTPFGSNFNEVPQLRKILVDNGCPVDDGQCSLVLDTTAGAALRSLAQLQKANEAGNDIMLRQGTLLNLQNLMLKESGQIGVVTKGTGASYQSNNVAGYTAGSSSIAVDTGSGTVLAGDIVTFTGDTNKYVVNTALAAGSLAIGTPGLRAALADNVAMTVGNNYTANIALHRAALEVGVRPPAMPMGGDAAVDSLLIADPRSGLAFEVAAYKGYMKAMFEVRCVAGAKAWKPDFIATLLG